jgi:hypothetical protein
VRAPTETATAQLFATIAVMDDELLLTRARGSREAHAASGGGVVPMNLEDDLSAHRSGALLPNIRENGRFSVDSDEEPLPVTQQT